MKFAKWTFLIAGIYGLLLVAPMVFMEQQMSQNFPPAINHPEYFYGFVIGTTAWQLVFLLIGRDPARYRALMLPAILEKTYGIAALVLFAQGRIPAVVFGFCAIDLLLGVLFVIAYVKTREAAVMRHYDTLTARV
jgi:hypothetical protein